MAEQATTQQSTPTSQGELSGVHAQRARLRAAMDGVEAVLASALGGRTAAWSADLQPAMATLRDTVAHHIAVTEGPGGLFEQIQTDSPRLSGAVQRLHVEHEQLAAEVDAVLEQLGEGSADPIAMAALRERVTTLIGRIARHRQRGADLIYDAYEVDIGGG